MTTGTDVLNAAGTELGLSEHPPGSNCVPGITDFLRTANGFGTGCCQWCVCWVSKVLAIVGLVDLCNLQGPGAYVNGCSYVPTVLENARTGRNGMAVVATPEPGDGAIVRWPGGNNEGDHIGIYVGGHGSGSVQIDSGNFHDSSNTATIPESDVLAYVRWSYGAASSVGHPTGPTPPPPTPAPPAPTQGPPYPGFVLHLSSPMQHDSAVGIWQQKMSDRGWHISVDGWYGPASEATARQFQAEGHPGPDGRPLTVDGVVGPMTWWATWNAPVT